MTVSILEFADGLVLTSDDFDGIAVDELEAETIISKVQELAEADGVKLEDGGTSTGDGEFHIDGTLFTFTVEDEEVLIEEA